MKAFKQILTLCLAFLMLAMPMLSVSAAIGEAEGDYIRYRVLSAADLLSYMDGVTVGEAERAFLDQYCETEVVFNAAIPGELITLSGTEAVAAPYQTETTDGRNIAWTVTDAVVLNPSEGVATATYKGSLLMRAADANSLRTLAWEEVLLAETAQSAIQEYNSRLEAFRAYPNLLAAYQQAQLNYEEYVAKKQDYDAEYALYLQYKAEWATYHVLKAKYDAYVTAKAEYDTKKAAYDAEQAQYSQAMTQYNKEYQAYTKNAKKIINSMLPMERMFVEYGALPAARYGGTEDLTVGSLYQALQNEDLVKMLLQYKTPLCSATSLTEADFNHLKTSSDELNALLQQYAEKREISEKEAFAFYQQNHAEISQKFNYLYESMTKILSPSVYSLMCAYVDQEFGDGKAYKKWRIKNVLCQIYLFSKCLDDSATATVNWTFYADDGDPQVYFYNDLINTETQGLTDLNNFSPAGLTWVDPPKEPDPPKLTMPIEPTPAVAKPTEPLEKEEDLVEPTAPTPVVTKPTAPEVVAEPQRPEQSVYDRVVRCEGLLEAKQSGQLVERSTVSTDQTLMLTETVSRRYDPDTMTWLDSIYDENGALCEQREDVAEAWEEAGGKYRLLGFKSGGEGLCHYPIYEREDRIFTVTFRSGEQVLSQRDYGYGQMPQAPAEPTKASTDADVYTFESWTPAISPVKGDVTYEAKFTRHDRQYAVTFKMKDATVVQQLTWQATPVPPTPTSQIRDGVYLYRWVGWNKVIVPVTGDVTYEAVYVKTVLVETQPEETPTQPETPGGGSTETPAPNPTPSETPEDPSSPTPTPGLTQNQTGYVVETGGSRLQIEGLLSLCRETNKGLSFDLTDHQSRVELSRSAVASLQEQGVVQVAYLSELVTGGRGVGVAFYDSEGVRVYPEGTVRLYLPVGDGQGRILLRRYMADGSTVNMEDDVPVDGAFLINIERDETYGVVHLYRLTVLCEGEGTVLPTELVLEAGVPLSLNCQPSMNYRFAKLILTNSVTGECVELTELDGLLMPAYDGVLTVYFEEILYTVEFRYHGGSETQTYRFGEEVVPPKIETSFVEDGKYYSFIGWSPNIESATEDAVYEAKYEIVSEEKATDRGEGKGAMSGVVRYWILPAVGIGLGVAAVVSVGVILLVKLLKKRRNQVK